MAPHEPNSVAYVEKRADAKRPLLSYKIGYTTLEPDSSADRLRTLGLGPLLKGISGMRNSARTFQYDLAVKNNRIFNLDF